MVHAPSLLPRPWHEPCNFRQRQKRTEETMSENYRPKDEKEQLDGSFGENPGYPARKRPSDWGVGKEALTPPPEPDSSPRSKTTP